MLETIGAVREELVNAGFAPTNKQVALVVEGINDDLSSYALGQCIRVTLKTNSTQGYTALAERIYKRLEHNNG